MNRDLLFLQASHVLYFVAALGAWNKGYRGFSLALFAMIAVSLANHRYEQIRGVDASALEWFEKTLVIITGIYGAILFREYIDRTTWLILGGSIILFWIGHIEYYQVNGDRAYTFAHTLWHISTGFAILRIISNAPNNIL